MVNEHPELASPAELISRIYDTVLAPASWPDVLWRVAEFVGAAGSIVFVHEPHEGAVRLDASHLSANYTRQALQAYLARYRSEEGLDQALFEATAMDNDGIKLVSDAELTPGDLGQQRNSRFLRAFQLKSRAAALLDKDDPTRDRFSLQFAADRGPITAPETARANSLLPHLAKAFAIGRLVQQLRAAETMAFGVLDRLDLGIAIVDGHGQPLFQNNEFQRIVDVSGMLGIDAAGRLRISADSGQRELVRLMGGYNEHGHFGARPRKEAITLGEPGQTAGYSVEVSPLAGCDLLGTATKAANLVVCLDAEAGMKLDLSAMSRLFALSASECRVLEWLAAGHTNSQIAELHDRSVETINSQVKALLAKTGCPNRTAMVRLAVGVGRRLLAS